MVALAHGGGGGTTGRPAAEDATAEESTFERSVSVHAATAETGYLASGVETGHGLAVSTEDSRREVSVEAT
jgi:hypothetical protein